jgi:hypothetical protein
VAAYVSQNFTVVANGAKLAREVLDGGADIDGDQPIWWVLVQWKAARPVKVLGLKVHLLFGIGWMRAADDRSLAEKNTDTPGYRDRAIRAPAWTSAGLAGGQMGLALYQMNFGAGQRPVMFILIRGDSNAGPPNDHLMIRGCALGQPIRFRP